MHRLKTHHLELSGHVHYVPVHSSTACPSFHAKSCDRLIRARPFSCRWSRSFASPWSLEDVSLQSTLLNPPTRPTQVSGAALLSRFCCGTACAISREFSSFAGDAPWENQQASFISTFPTSPSRCMLTLGTFRHLLMWPLGWRTMHFWRPPIKNTLSSSARLWRILWVMAWWLHCVNVGLLLQLPKKMLRRNGWPSVPQPLPKFGPMRPFCRISRVDVSLACLYSWSQWYTGFFAACLSPLFHLAFTLR